MIPLTPCDHDDCSKTGCAKPGSVQRLVMPLELALTRWSVVHREWHEIGGDCPLLTAFLAGWCCRSIGASMPDDLGMFRDSFRVGWREADDMMTIEARRHNDQAER